MPSQSKCISTDAAIHSLSPWSVCTPMYSLWRDNPWTACSLPIRTPKDRWRRLTQQLLLADAALKKWRTDWSANLRPNREMQQIHRDSQDEYTLTSSSYIG